MALNTHIKKEKKKDFFLWKMSLLHCKASGRELNFIFFSSEAWDSQVYDVLVTFGTEVYVSWEWGFLEKKLDIQATSITSIRKHF